MSSFSAGRTHRAKIRLLLVDDEEAFLEATSRALFRRGFDVRRARNGAEALEALASHPPDRPFQIVLLDVKMPQMNGLEVLAKIQALSSPPPVIMLTGHGSMDHAVAAVHAGAYEFVTKPCDLDALATLAATAAGQQLSPDAPNPVRSDRAPTGSVAMRVGAKEAVQLLIIDDETDLLESLAVVLSRRGMTVTTAPDGASGLALMAAHDYDVVLLDLTLPGMDGIEILRQIKDTSPTTEVILLTGHPSMGSAAEGLREGVFDYLVKPQSIQRLTERIQDAYHRRKRRSAPV